MKKQSFSGTGVALITPFKNGKVDFPALERIIQYNIAGGVNYLVSLGTTGEAITLSSKECRKVLDFTIKITDGRVPIVAGIFGDNNTATLQKKVRQFDFDGIDGILSSSPSYNKPSQEGIFQHYMTLAEAASKPIIIYNVPGRTSSNILPETIIRLAETSPLFAAVKEASGNVVQGASIIKHKPDHFLVLSGDDPTAIPLISCGASGVISVIANALPGPFSKMISLALSGKFARATALHLKMLDLHQWLYVDGNPAGIKAVMEILGFCSQEMRLPLTPMQQHNYISLKAELNQVLSSIKHRTYNLPLVDF